MGLTTLYLHAMGLWHVWSSIESSRSNSCISDITTTTTFCRIHFFIQIFALYIESFFGFLNILLQRIMNFSNASINSQVLSLSQTGCHDDVTIVCANGILQSNSFVLAAMFPVLRGILETPVQYDDRAVRLQVHQWWGDWIYAPQPEADDGEPQSEDHWSPRI